MRLGRSVFVARSHAPVHPFGYLEASRSVLPLRVSRSAFVGLRLIGRSRSDALRDPRRGSLPRLFARLVPGIRLNCLARARREACGAARAPGKKKKRRKEERRSGAGALFTLEFQLGFVDCEGASGTPKAVTGATYRVTINPLPKISQPASRASTRATLDTISSMRLRTSACLPGRPETISENATGELPSGRKAKPLSAMAVSSVPVLA